MKSFVLDASIALSWCFVDEKTPLTDDLLNQIASGKHSVLVPNLWPLEIGNILVNAERRKRISYAQVSECLDMLGSLPIHIDEETAQKSFHEILSLAYAEKITTYDAAYLELALRKRIPLASKDKALCKAAERLGIKTL
jgi:predicted nucleic acid-binding protein